jgi:thioester reductase-like protein
VSTYFVTGTTGAVGGAVVATLLRDPDSRVVALARRGEAEAGERVRRALVARPDFGAITDALDRVTVVTGDVEAPAFGLAPADAAIVSNDCARLIHCAGVVRMNLPVEAARRAAVTPARSFVELMRSARDRGRAAKLDFVSTVGVGGRDVRRVPETWVTGARAFHNTYEQAKAEAEDVMREAVQDGLAITVHRPSMVIGDSRNGWTPHFQVFYHLAEFLLGQRTRGLFPSFGDVRLDVVPSDAVAAAIAWSSAASSTSGRVLNLCAGPHDAIALNRLRGLVAAAARARGLDVPPARSVPRWAFRAAVRGLGAVVDERTRRALSTLPVFLDYLESGQVFENDETRALLRGAGMTIPPIETYLARVLDFWFDTRADAAPKKKA